MERSLGNMASVTCLLLQATQKITYVALNTGYTTKENESLAFYIAMPSSNKCTPAHTCTYTNKHTHTHTHKYSLTYSQAPTAYNAQPTRCACTHIHTWEQKWKCNHVNITLASSQRPGLIMAGLTSFISSLQKKELIFSCKYMYKALHRNTFPSSLVCIFFFPVHNYHQILKVLIYYEVTISDNQSFIKHSKNVVLLVFYDVFTTHYIAMMVGLVSNDLEKISKVAEVDYSRYEPSIPLEGMRKT